MFEKIDFQLEFSGWRLPIQHQFESLQAKIMEVWIQLLLNHTSFHQGNGGESFSQEIFRHKNFPTAKFPTQKVPTETLPKKSGKRKLFHKKDSTEVERVGLQMALASIAYPCISILIS